MGINIDYSPMGAIGQLSYGAGYGQYQQKQQAIGQELAMRQAALAQQDQQDQRHVLAGLYGQQQSQFGHLQSQLLGGNIQFGLQQQHAQRQELTARYGMYAHLMTDINGLEKQGYTYSPTDQKTLEKLDSDRSALMNDDAVDQQQKAQAERDYFARRVMIRPSAPPPKSEQEYFDESGFVTKTMPDGRTLMFTVGNRNGARSYNQIEDPAEKNKFVAEQTQLKMQHQREMHDAKVAQQAAAMQMGFQKHQLDMSMQTDEHVRKAKQDLFNHVMNQYLAYTTAVSKLQEPKTDPLTGKATGPSVEQQRAVKAAAFKAAYGNLLLQVNPDVAAAEGIERTSTIDDSAEATDIGDGQWADQPQGQGQQAAPQQQQAPQPQQPQFDPGRVQRAKVAAEAALHSRETSAAQKADAQALLDELRQRGL